MARKKLNKGAKGSLQEDVLKESEEMGVEEIEEEVKEDEPIKVRRAKVTFVGGRSDMRGKYRFPRIFSSHIVEGTDVDMFVSESGYLIEYLD